MIKVRVVHSRSVEASESAKRVAAVYDAVEEGRGIGDQEVPAEEKELVLGRLDSAVEGFVSMELRLDFESNFGQRIDKRSDHGGVAFLVIEPQPSPWRHAGLGEQLFRPVEIGAVTPVGGAEGDAGGRG
jgi:hypothetical protein